MHPVIFTAWKRRVNSTDPFRTSSPSRSSFVRVPLREGVTEGLRRAFLVYLLSHNRPWFEVLSPRKKSLQAEYKSSFLGMTSEPASLKALTEARKALIDVAVRQMPEPHRHFLLSFERGQPDWPLLALPGAADLPAVRWRQDNLEKLSSAQRARLVSHLERIPQDWEKEQAGAPQFPA